MSSPAPATTRPTYGHNSRQSSGSFSGDDEDIFFSIDTRDGVDEFLAIEQPQGVVKKDNMQKEKQIAVDPISLQESNIRKASFRLVSTPPRPPKSPGQDHRYSSLPPPPPPPKLKFVSSSLPNSASPSPRFSSASSKMTPWTNKNDDDSPPSAGSSVVRRGYSGMDDIEIDLRESVSRKSKSVGERRSSTTTNDFNLMLDRRSATESMYNASSFPEPEKVRSFRSHSNSKRAGSSSRERRNNIAENSFKCGKLCLFLPRGKGKPVRAGSTNSISSFASAVPSSMASHKTDLPRISNRISLERFECESWASSAIIEDDEGEATSLFFDLPVELIRCSVSDMQSPVTAAFVFDKDAQSSQEPQGVV